MRRFLVARDGDVDKALLVQNLSVARVISHRAAFEMRVVLFSKRLFTDVGQVESVEGRVSRRYTLS